jgi:hypothetical protein
MPAEIGADVGGLQLCSGLRLDMGAICSPNSSSGMPNTAQSRTPGIWISTVRSRPGRC